MSRKKKDVSKKKDKKNVKRARSTSKKTKQTSKKQETLVIIGYRKKAIARGYIRKGNGSIRVNGKPLESYFPKLLLYRILEPVYLAGEDKMKNISIEIDVHGGGITGQSDAVRQIIAKALVEYYKDDALKEMFIDYDRSLLVPDVRQTEPHKPSRSKQGPRRKKQLSKR